MSLALKTRNPRNGGNRAQAIRFWNDEQIDTSDAPQRLQVQRLRSAVNCSEATAKTLASLIFGEIRS